MNPAVSELCSDYTQHAEHYRDPQAAKARCWESAEAFTAFCSERGVEAFPLASWADELEFAQRVNTPWLQDDTHVVTVVRVAGRTFTVDWTASQYGRSEFPLVRELVELPPHNPWLLTDEQARRRLADLRSAAIRRT